MNRFALVISLLLFESVLSPLGTCQSQSQSQEKFPAQSAMKPRKILDLGKGQVAWVAFSPDGMTLATGSHRGGSRLWNVKTGLQLKMSFEIPKGGVMFLPDGKTLAVGAGKKISLWNIETGQQTATLVEKNYASEIVFSPDSKKIATGSIDGPEVHIWNVQTGRLESTLVHPKPDEYLNGVTNLVFANDCKTLITSSFERIYLWDVAEGNIRSKLIDPSLSLVANFWHNARELSHGSTIYTIDISPNGKLLASASRDGTAKLWDLDKVELRSTLFYIPWTWNMVGQKVVGVKFSPDGQTLAASSEDRNVRLFNTTTGKQLAILQHRGTPQSVDFSPDGKLLATGSDNEKAVNVWNTSTGELITKLENARYPVAFSPDGRTLATASGDKKVLLWDVPK